MLVDGVWIVVIIAGLAGVVFTLSRSRLSPDRRLIELGTVSHTWIAEQRLGQGHDSRS